MQYKLTFVQEPAYLHAIVTGLNSMENVAHYLDDLVRECKLRGCQRLLIEERLEGPRLNTTNVFRVASDGSARAHGYFIAIAYVDVNAEGDLMKFAETVAVNRGVPVRVFSSVSDAKEWLAEGNRNGAEPDTAAEPDGPRR